MKKCIFIFCIFSFTKGFCFWGGDLIYLSKILEQSIYQLEQLRSMTELHKDQLRLLKEVNRGFNDVMFLRDTANQTLKAGTFSDIRNVNEAISVVRRLYGRIPKTWEAPLQKKTDLTVAESLYFQKEAFKYATKIDKEATKIKNYANKVSPTGASKTLVQSQAIMLHTLNQILRTTASLLKIHSQGLALKNKKEKIRSRHFQIQYNELSKAFYNLKPNYTLSSL